jgi:hypothetical protein
MGLGLIGFIRALFLALTRRRLTLRRIGFYWLFLPVFSFLFLIVWAGQLVDSLFFPGYRTQPVSSPLFIIATPRSGTTLLHRALCLDKNQFSYFRTYQTLLPSVSLYKFTQSISRLDQRLSNPVARTMHWVSDRLFKGWKHIHPTGLMQAEEDEGLFIYSFFTPAVYMLFPVINRLPLFRFCDDLPPRKRTRLMAYYKGCLQRFLFSYGQDRALLSKNVLSIGRLRSLLETFPDARLIYIVRHPYQAIPSLLNLFYVVWRSHSPEILKDSNETRALAQMSFDYYRYLTQATHQIPAKQAIFIPYEELVSNLPGVVERIYAHFDLTLEEDFRSRLAQLAASMEDYKSAHKYSLEEFGLNEDMIWSALSDVFEDYGFSR